MNYDVLQLRQTSFADAELRVLYERARWLMMSPRGRAATRVRSQSVDQTRDTLLTWLTRLAN